MEYLGHFLLVGGIFAVIDALWIGVVANKFYKSQMGDLLMDKPNFVPAVIFYIIYIFAIVFLVLGPALESGSMQELITKAVVFGLAAYATYDLTNASTLKKWPKAVTIVDMIWGTTATTVVSVIAFLILN